MEGEVIDAQKPRGAALNYKPNTLPGSRRRRNPPCNAEDNLRVEHLVIEAWFGGYGGSPGLRGPRASGLLAMGRADGM